VAVIKVTLKQAAPMTCIFANQAFCSLVGCTMVRVGDPPLVGSQMVVVVVMMIVTMLCGPQSELVGERAITTIVHDYRSKVKLFSLAMSSRCVLTSSCVTHRPMGAVQIVFSFLFFYFFIFCLLILYSFLLERGERITAPVRLSNLLIHKDGTLIRMASTTQLFRLTDGQVPALSLFFFFFVFTSSHAAGEVTLTLWSRARQAGLERHFLRRNGEY
jgi:hypothetical protein